MPRRTDGWPTDKTALPPKDALEDSGERQIADRATCDCADFRRDHVCDHVLLAAAVRMVRRMIDAHEDPDKPPH